MIVDVIDPDTWSAAAAGPALLKLSTGAQRTESDVLD